MSRLSLAEAISILENKGYTVEKKDWYKVRNNVGVMDFPTGRDLVKFVRGLCKEIEDDSSLLSIEELNKMLNEEKNKIESLGYKLCKIIPGIEIRNYRCYYGLTEYEGDKAKISLSKYYIHRELKDYVRETIMHELCHCVISCKEDGHGKEWQKVVTKVNNEYGYHISRLGTKERLSKEGVESPLNVGRKFKYKAICNECGSSFKVSRATNFIKHPNEYTCAKCHKCSWNIEEV